MEFTKLFTLPYCLLIISLQANLSIFKGGSLIKQLYLLLITLKLSPCLILVLGLISLIPIKVIETIADYSYILLISPL